MKIQMIGGSGSGKTFLANKLAGQYGKVIYVNKKEAKRIAKGKSL